MPGARLSLEEREEIARGIASGRSLTGIARGVGRPVSTVSREVARNGGRRCYRAVVAECATRRRAGRPKARRLAAGREVERRLRLRHSPQQIVNRLRLGHPDEPHWRVFHETIDQALYVQGRGGLKAELTDALRTG